MKYANRVTPFGAFGDGLIEHLKDTAAAMNEALRPTGHPVETAADAVRGTTQDIQKFRRQKAAAQAAAMCGASSTPDFLEAVAFYQDALEQIERLSKCVVCGYTLIGGDVECSRCGRIND